MDPKTISATDLARRLSEVLSRVRYGRESFVVVRNGQTVAKIEPPPPEVRSVNVEDFLRAAGHLKVPRGLGSGLEEANKVFRESPGSEPQPWDS